MTDGGRTGRRPGRSGARDDILAAARTRFAEVGFENASVRSIAVAAGVDPALVHHYFGTKQELFAAVLQLPVNPAVVTDAIAAAPLDKLGEQIVRVVVGAWDSPIGDAAAAIFRSALGGTDPQLLRTFLWDIALKAVRERVDSPPGTGATRVGLAVSQMIGLLVGRKIIGIEPLASMSLDDLARHVGPTLQRYLTGDPPWYAGS